MKIVGLLQSAPEWEGKDAACKAGGVHIFVVR